MSTLSEHERKRYKRHLVLDEIGESGQLQLKSGKALVVGSGGLGSPVLYYLTAAGVGTIGVVDNDVVEISNLQRQILHSTPDLGQPKTVSAYEKLAKLNPETKILTVNERLTAKNAGDIIGGYDVVVDATDNFPTRFILNEACVKAGVPFVHGGIMGFFGQALTVVPGSGPCFACIFREPPTPGTVISEPGVMGAVAGTIGTVQATEVIKFLLGKGRLLVGRLLMYDALEASWREVAVKRDPECQICGSCK